MSKNADDICDIISQYAKSSLREPFSNDKPIEINFSDKTKQPEYEQESITTSVILEDK